MVFEMGNITMILRILQMLFSFLVLALISSAISNRFYYDQDGFLLFTSLLSMASVAYIIFTPIFLAQFHHIFAVMALEGVNVLFWFCGWIAEAASGGRLNCSINVNGFYLFSSSYKQGCGSGKAAAAFGAFTWILWVITMVMLIRTLLNEGRFPGIGGNTATANDTALGNVNGAGVTNPGDGKPAETATNTTAMTQP